jgi:tripartite-type tricarboxylate transporter receptor subunit TctC
MSSNRRANLQMLGALALMQPWLSMAQTQAPTPGTTRLLVGFPPGATGDRIARAVSPLLAAQLQNSVIVDNKPGAGGQLAIEYAKSAHADGSVLLQTIGSSMVIYPHTYAGFATTRSATSYRWAPRPLRRSLSSARRGCRSRASATPSR